MTLNPPAKASHVPAVLDRVAARDRRCVVGVPGLPHSIVTRGAHAARDDHFGRRLGLHDQGLLGEVLPARRLDSRTSRQQMPSAWAARRCRAPRRSHPRSGSTANRFDRCSSTSACGVGARPTSTTPSSRRDRLARLLTAGWPSVVSRRSSNSPRPAPLRKRRSPVVASTADVRLSRQTQASASRPHSVFPDRRHSGSPEPSRG